MKRTLVLNASYEPLIFCSWEKAISLVFAGKAEAIEECPRTVIRTVSQSYPVPLVIRLSCFVSTHLVYSIKCNRHNVFLRDNYICQYCEKKCSPSKVSIDHVIPKSKGGLLQWDNVVTACHRCNRVKGNRYLHQTHLKLKTPPRKPTWKILFFRRVKKIDKTWEPYLGISA